jgi:hypothetical protein
LVLALPDPRFGVVRNGAKELPWTFKTVVPKEHSMAVLERRSKLVSFRLSEQEYRSLVAVCEARGARSVSEAARDAVHNLLGVNGTRNRVKTKLDTKLENGLENGLENRLEDKLVQLQGRVEDLDRELKRLAAMVAGPASGT